MRKTISCLVVLALIVGLMGSGNVVYAEGSMNLETALDLAKTSGFCYEFWGDNQVFDGTRVISGTATDIARLKASNKGTLIVRYKTSNATDQVLFAAGNNYAANNYGAILANNTSGAKLQRIDFPNGMYANLSGTTISSDWHTFVYSVDASSLPTTTGKTVTSFDGSTTTQYPNYASWFNANTTINNIQYLKIGGAGGTLANSNNNTNFIGNIAFVAFIPDTVTQSEAAAISASDWPLDLYTAENLSITSASNTITFDSTLLSTLRQLDDITIIAKYRNTGTGIGSLFSISDPTKSNSHFHFYEYGNSIGFEFRNNDSPKYSSTCGNVQSGEYNTVAFKAEDGVGYKMFANGVLGSTVSQTTSYQFLSDLTSQTVGHIGQTERPSGINNYLFTGDIVSIEIYGSALPDTYLQSRTAETATVDPRVFYNGDSTGSKFFRIPFLLATAGGSLIAGTDANFGSTGDSAENIDVAIRVKPNAASKTAMSGWSNATVPTDMHMLDYNDSPGYRQDSASFIDGVIYEDTVYNDRVYVMIDAWTWNGGVFSYLNIDAAGQAHGGTNRSVAYGDGFCKINGQKYLLLSSQNIMGSDTHGTNNINNNTTRANFNYAADVYGSKNSNGRYNIYNLVGTPKEYSGTGTTVVDSNLSLGSLSQYSLSTDYELYSNGTLQTVLQRSTDTTYTTNSVPMKIFYKDSTLQMYNTSYLIQFYSDDNGVTWNTDKILNGMVKPENSRYYITGPGQGIQLKNGAHAGRILVPVYAQLSGVSGIGSPATSVIYSDDGGVTWVAGNVIPTTLGLHESALVEMPNGSVKIFVRNTSSSGGKFVTATSIDGGVNWVDVASALGDNYAGTNCQISAIGLSQQVVDPNNTSSSYPALLMTSPYNNSRTNGITWVGLIKPNGTYSNGTIKYTIDWAYQYAHTTTGLFAYSSMTQLSDGRIGMLYETSPDSSWSTGLQGLYYKEFTINTLIGAD